MKEKRPEFTWTFITNHAAILHRIVQDPIVTARDLSMAVGITERAVRKIIAELMSEGYIRKTKEGRRVRYAVNHDVPLRHKTQRDKAVGDLLNLLSSMDKKPT
jgi:ribosomal protein S19E (S16A)